MARALRIARDARLLLDVATRESDPDRVADELDAVAEAIRAGGDGGLLVHGGVPPARKVQAVQGLVARLGFTPLVGRLMIALAQRDALRVLPELAAAFRGRLLERRNVVRAVITTAVPIGGDAADRVARALGEASGKQVLISTRVDPAIIGGVVARVGSTVYDGSVATQLARMRHKLVENV